MNTQTVIVLIILAISYVCHLLRFRSHWWALACALLCLLASVVCFWGSSRLTLNSAVLNGILIGGLAIQRFYHWWVRRNAT